MKKIFIDYEYSSKKGIHEFLYESSTSNFYQAYKFNNHFFIKIISKLIRVDIFFLPYKLLFGKWFKELDNTDVVIITINYYTLCIIKFINKKFPHITVYAYYFNIVEKDVPIQLLLKLNCKLCTFDSNDAKKYSMDLILQPISLGLLRKYESSGNLYDVFFIGADKGRLKTLLNTQRYLEENHFTTKFYIINTGKKRDAQYQYSKPISYNKYLELASNARCLLEIKQNNQFGPTLRPLEAGILKKKLITNDENIINSKYYNENNVYILGEKRNITEFMKLPFQDIYDYEENDISRWIEKF